jgi:phosphoglycolate phosphatase
VSQPLIAFDLDGTLIDSRVDLAESANELLASFGAPPLPVETVAAMVGDGARVLVRRVLAAARLDPERPDPLERFLAIYDRRLANHTRFYPGLLEMIEPLSRRAGLAIVTNKPERHTRELLRLFGVSACFRWTIAGDSGFPRKPDPAGLLHVVREAGVEPRAALYVGDSMVDVETGRRAGVRMCVAAYGFAQFRGDLALEGTELVAERPEDLPGVIEAFLAAPG